MSQRVNEMPPTQPDAGVLEAPELEELELDVAPTPAAEARPGRWTSWTRFSAIPKPVRRWGIALGVLLLCLSFVLNWAVSFLRRRGAA